MDVVVVLDDLLDRGQRRLAAQSDGEDDFTDLGIDAPGVLQADVAEVTLFEPCRRQLLTFRWWYRT